MKRDPTVTTKLSTGFGGTEWIAVSAILLFGLLLRLDPHFESVRADPFSEPEMRFRLRGIDNPLTDHTSFRQGTVAMMAREFYREGIDIQYPRIKGYGLQGWTFWINEFPLYPATLATLYKLTGEEPRVGRAVSIFFSLATAFVLYLILRISFTNSAPYWAMLLFSIAPIGAYLGRCVVRHPMAFFFQALAFLFWLVWLKKPSWAFWVGTWLAGAITVLMNFANAYIGLPMALALFLVRGQKGLRDRRVWTLLVAMLAPGVLWLRHALEFGAAFLAASGEDIEQRDLGRFLRLEWVNESFFTHMGEGFLRLLLTPVGIALVILGISILWRSKMAWLVRAWCFASLLYLCIDHYVVYIVPHDYYFAHLLIPLSLAGGIGAGALVDWAKRLFPEYPGFTAATASVVLGLTLFQSWQVYYFPLRTQWMETEVVQLNHWLPAAEKIRELTDPDDGVVVDRAEDALIYYCDRRGWVNDKERLLEESIRSLISNGAEYLLLTTYKMEGDRFTGYHFYDPPPDGAPGAAWVAENCPVVHEGLTFQIVDLQPEKHGRVPSATQTVGEPTGG